MTLAFVTNPKQLKGQREPCLFVNNLFISHCICMCDKNDAWDLASPKLNFYNRALDEESVKNVEKTRINRRLLL